MKLKRLEVITDVNPLYNKEDDFISLPVKITTSKSWFGGKEKTFTAFPSRKKRSLSDGTMDFLYYFDEIGEELPDYICEQINNFLLAQRRCGKMNDILKLFGLKY